MYGAVMNNPGQNDLNVIIQRGYSVDIGGFINRGWAIFQTDIASFVLFCLITGIINIALTVIGALPFISFIGPITSLIIGGPLYAGYFIAAFKIGKNQSTSFEDFFKGFQNSYFLQIFLASLMVGVLTFFCLIPAIIIFVLSSVLPLFSVLPNDNFPGGNEPNVILLAMAGLCALIGLVGALYLGVSYTFAIPLVVGKSMDFWSAMETSRKLISQQWFSFFCFMLVLGVINIVGSLPCFIGLLFTIPLTACAIAAAYESIIGLSAFNSSEA
jgi:hypothetical protein